MIETISKRHITISKYVTMSYTNLLDEEIGNLRHLLRSIPFSQKTDETKLSHFLNIYKLNYPLVLKTISSNNPSIDSNKLLKLGISLGNLIKSFENDQELFQQQSRQQKSFVNNTNKYKVRTTFQTGTALAQPADFNNPFQEQVQVTKHVINSGNQPMYQIKFIKHLLSILKNFDIGSIHEDLSHSQLTATINQINLSPIKLNSRQLLIEKLETNIRLDTLFIYKIVFKLLIKIYDILKENTGGPEFLEAGAFNNNASRSIDDTSSIFSSNSNNSSESSVISVDEYLRILKVIVNRVLSGLVKPFVKVILNEIVENKVHEDFNKLLDGL